MFQLLFLHSQEDKKRISQQLFVDRKQNSFNIAYIKELSNSFKVNAKFSYDRYKFSDVVLQDRRFDETYISYLSLNKEINDSFSVVVDYKNINNNSNYIPVAYEKNSYGIKLNMDF